MKVNRIGSLLKIGGFGAHVGHDAHLIYTCSAVQILAIQDALDSLDAEKVINCISSRSICSQKT
jgi:prenyltransferase beta subunit